MLHIVLFGLAAAGLLVWVGAALLPEPASCRRQASYVLLILSIVLALASLVHLPAMTVSGPGVEIKWEWFDWIGLVVLILVIAGLWRGESPLRLLRGVAQVVSAARGVGTKS